ncbi:MAG: hypothetical protein IVW52_20000, partial [Acidimicrobiales bacterium]|nr:hypothetical protein [Acidimicrobiales bacterium]
PDRNDEVSPDLPSLSALLNVAIDVAKAGGRRTLEFFGGRVEAETKQDGSPVTSADRESEDEMRRKILHAFPSHTIIGEEKGLTQGDSRIRWIIDPLDLHSAPAERAIPELPAPSVS